jgi:hypothetical protein
VAVVGFSEGGVVEVVPVEPPSLRRGPDLTD